ncbi:flagellar basal body-associated FliL family protein [Limibaculum sp. M0105]|uniref:Flagellar protein FliL n=2 Tax=Thermohalobaculum xanthum TaxID=2753746 RepID=A0A8J7M4H8_9RHOB|nr:flagellar basal body-associated FliL family protein [Thermohalobaculum xanthum]
MSDTAGKRGRGMFIALAGASLLIGVGAGFYGVSSGLVPAPPILPASSAAGAAGLESWPAPSFVLLSPLTVSLGPEARARHLRVALQLEVAPGSERAVAEVVPRVLDVLNMFLRAVDEREFEMPRAMARLRAQMLRRVQLVSPPGAVHDVLIQEFVLS